MIDTYLLEVYVFILYIPLIKMYTFIFVINLKMMNNDEM